MKINWAIFLSWLLSACQVETSRPISLEKTTRIHTPLISAKCEAKLAHIDARAIFSQSPTLSATIDHEGNANVNARMDLMDYSRSEIEKELSLANCNQEEVVTLIRDIARVNANKLARNSLILKVQYLHNHAKKFDAKVAALSRSGAIDGLKTEKLFKAVNNIRKQASRSEARSQTLEPIEFAAIPKFSELEDRLFESMANTKAHAQRSELYKNVRVNLIGGVRYTREDNDSASTYGSSDEVENYGNVTVSIRLGIFDPRYKAQQSRILDREYETLFEPNTGLLWQLKDLYLENAKAAKFLAKERALITTDIAGLDRALAYETKADRVLANQISKTLLTADILRIDRHLSDLRLVQNKLIGSLSISKAD